MSVVVSAASSAGAIRAENQDAFAATGFIGFEGDGDVVSTIVSSSPAVVVVADGLGGHPRGDLASRLVVDYVVQARPHDPETLMRAFRAANEVLFDAMARDADCSGMGTTAVALVQMERGIALANVGDSPAFEFSDGRLVQLTIDDVPSTTGALPGLPTAGVTQVLGVRRFGALPDPHLYFDDFGGERRFLLCTDGLTTFVPRSEIAEILSTHSGAAAVRELLNLAMTSGGQDNVTVVLVELLIGGR